MAIMRQKSEPQQQPVEQRRPTPETGAAISLIGAGMRIDGDCEADRLRIEGQITGNVRASNLVVSAGGRVDGDVIGPDGGEGADSFIIEGRVGGAVRARRVEVRPNGEVAGGIYAYEAVVEGRVSGGVVAEHRLLLEERGFVEGDVRAVRLALKEGGQVNGNIQMGERAKAALSKSSPSRPGSTPASRETASKPQDEESRSGQSGKPQEAAQKS